MIQNINENNKLSFLLSKTHSIDLEALNLLASGTEQILCGCSYCEYNGRHRINYDVSLSDNMYLRKDLFIFENFIQNCLELFEVIDRCGMNLVNLKLGAKFIFKYNDIYRFVYIPIVTKKKISKKKFIVKLFSQFGKSDMRVADSIKKIKKMKADNLIIDYLKTYVSTTTMHSESESETTILSEHRIETDMEGETTILSEHTTEFLTNTSAECETTFLSETPLLEKEREVECDAERSLFLLRVGTGEQIHINKTAYSIGKDIQTMDYVLGNQSVSRNHATIYIEDNKFYLSDNGSTNGTTIEGIRVQTGERVELSDGDIISLGNEVFQILLERK